MATEGKRIRTRHLEVRALASPLDHSRIGLIVPRHGRTAVARNQLKRRLREISRTALLPVLGAQPLDMVIRARREAYAVEFEDLRAELVRAIGQLPSRLAPSEAPSVPGTPAADAP